VNVDLLSNKYMEWSMFKWPAWQFEFHSIFTVFVILLATLLAGKVSLKKDHCLDSIVYTL